MTIVNAGFDIHRAQITFDALDVATGEVLRGRIDSTPEAVIEWVGRFPEQEIHVALEACTGWHFVVRALESAGAVPHLAEVAETSTLRRRKRRAKTGRADARWLRELLTEGRLPEAWIPPDHICELRARTRIRKTLVDEATSWRQRIQATLFHLGQPSLPTDVADARPGSGLKPRAQPGRPRADRGCPGDDRGARGPDRPDRARAEALRLRSGRLPGAHLAPLRDRRADRAGDRRRARQRHPALRQAVRLAGLDVGVHRSDRTRAGSAS